MMMPHVDLWVKLLIAAVLAGISSFAADEVRRWKDRRG